MADTSLPTFNRARFAIGLRTRFIGRELIVRASVDSTNDVAWDALAAGAPDGTTVVADAQVQGRGREGRTWYTAPGRGLAMSALLRAGCEREALVVLPLAAGLALAEAFDALGARATLKWPNDVMLSGRKVSGNLCESRRTPEGDDVVVVGIGVNVFQTSEEFPEPIRAQATSLAIEGVAADRETVAAAVLNAFEPLWTLLDASGAGGIVERWRARATFWGERRTVRTPAGEVAGVARGLDSDGALLLDLPDGTTTRVVAGDVLQP